MVRLSVEDTGVGTSPEVLVRIFSPFTQADGAISRRFGGIGLGLTICQRLAELMEPSISVESQEGVGSAFHLIVPLSVSRCRAMSNAPVGATRAM